MTKFKLRKSLEGKIPETAAGWGETIDTPMLDLKRDVGERGWLNCNELQEVALWLLPEKIRKTAKRHVLENSEEDVAAATAVALSSCDPYTQWEWLCGLKHGVRAAVASAVLHWFAEGNYPIASKDSLWSCSVDDGIADVHDWIAYTQFCRDLAAEHNITMRTLDRALCQHYRNEAGDEE